MQADALAYTRRLFETVFRWYTSAENKAQILLTLDGALLGVLGSAAFWNADTLRAALPQVGYEAVFFFFAFLFALAASILSALMCIRSRLRRLPQSTHVTPTPANMWFFQQLPALSPTAFEAALQEMDAGKEIKILSRQIQMLSFNVINKHLWFNRGYGALVMGLLCLIAVVATYVLRLYLGIEQRFSWPLLVVSVGIVTIALLVYYTLAVTERKQETMFQARFSAGAHGVDTGA